VVGCDSCGECDGAESGSWSNWLTGRWLNLGGLGSHHQPHPYCVCPRCRPRHKWASFDGLLWWGKGRSIPALVSGAPNGVLPDAPVLFGDGSVGNQMAAGARTDFGVWLDPCESLGVGAKFWGLDGDRTSFAVDDTTQAVIGRPFFNILPFVEAEDALLIASPGIATGGIQVTSSSSVLGGEAYLRSNILAGRGYHMDFVGGYHFMRLDDDLTITSNSTLLSGPAAGTLINVLDSFDARNEFHGGTLGAVTEIRRGRWTFTSLAKLSVGNMRQTVHISGSQTNTPPVGDPEIFPVGMLALSTNNGTHARDEVAWIPEFGINASYEVRSWMRLTVGYNAIWFSNVVFSGDQIDRNVNPTYFAGSLVQLPPPAPLFGFRDTDYWLHGLNLGLTFTF
jgi:hypothetical protein